MILGGADALAKSKGARQDFFCVIFCDPWYMLAP